MKHCLKWLPATAILLAATAAMSQAQNSIIVPLSPILASRTLGPDPGNTGNQPHIETGNGPDNVALTGFQPPNWAEWKVTTTTPGMYTISVQGFNNQDPSSVMQFETRQASAGNDLYATRYMTPDTKDYGNFSSDYWVNVDLGVMQDANGATLTVPLWSGDNIFRATNVSGRHMPATSYPPDLTDPNDRPWGAFWSNLRLSRITLTRVGDLPTFGTITGKVTGNKPAGVAVKMALVTANPTGQSPTELTNWWKNGYWTYTKEDGTYTLTAPTGTQEVMAGRPSSYELPGAKTSVSVPATGSATANIQLTSLFHTDIDGNTSASIQNEYFDAQTGLTGLLPVDGQNGYKMGWVDVGDANTMIVDAPQAGMYKVTSSYFNGGGEGTVRISTDLGSTARGQQPPGGWGTRKETVYAQSIYLVQGPNAVSQVLESGNSDQDGFLLTLLPDVPTVGQVKGVVTDTTTGQPAAGVTITLGINVVTTDAQGRYSIIANQGTNQAITATHPYQDAAVSSTVNVVAGGVTDQNFSIAIRPHLDLTTAAGHSWKVIPNTGGTADFSAVAADETGALSIDVPSNWDILPNAVSNMDLIYGWYRLHFTVPADFLTKFAGRQVTLHMGTVDDVDATYVNGTLVGSTGSFPTTPLDVQPAGASAAGPPQVFPAGLLAMWNVPRDYTFPASLLTSGDNVIAVKVFDHAGGGGLTAAPVTLSVALATGSISGTVKAGGAGVPNVRVTAMDLTGLASDWTWTDATGKYTLTHPNAGPVVIGVAKPGYSAVHSSLSLGSGQTVSNLDINVAAITDGPAPTYDDFNGTGTDWQTKFDAISEVDPTDIPYITEPGVDAATRAEIPSTITIDGGTKERGILVSKDRVSKYASISAARLVSALPAAANADLPNAIMQLYAPASDDITTISFSKYVELDVENYGLVGDQQRMRFKVFVDGPGQLGAGIVPTTQTSLSEVSPTAPLDYIIARTGSMLDFYFNGILVASANAPTFGVLPNHKVGVYSYTTASTVTWDWIKMGPLAAVGPVKGDLNGNGLLDSGDVQKALQIAAGLSTSTAADITSGDVVNDPGISLRDALRIMQALNGNPL